jgi:uncharacterized lipoprotein
MTRYSRTQSAGRLGWLLGLLLTLSLAGCSYWTHATKPATEFKADASACEKASLQASTAYDGPDTGRQEAYLACLRDKGWTLQGRR